MVVVEDHGSVFARVRVNPGGWDSYHTMTQGVLVGDPGSSETLAAREVLDGAAVAYLFRAEEGLVVPSFQMTCAPWVSVVGLGELRELVDRLVSGGV